MKSKPMHGISDREIVLTQKSTKVQRKASKTGDIVDIYLLKGSGFAHSDPKMKAALLNDQFSSVFTKDKEDPGELPSLQDEHRPKLHTLSIHETILKKCSRGSNLTKLQDPIAFQPTF